MRKTSFNNGRLRVIHMRVSIPETLVGEMQKDIDRKYPHSKPSIEKHCVVILDQWYSRGFHKLTDFEIVEGKIVFAITEKAQVK